MGTGPCKGRHGTYFQTEAQRMYNNGQTLFLVRDRYGRTAGLVVEGRGHMWSQNLIHDRDGWLLGWMGQVSRFYSESQPRYGITGRSIWGF